MPFVGQKDMVCSACKAAYGSGKPEHFGSDPVCGFHADGTFNSGNWNCAGLCMLRDLAEEIKWGRFSCRHEDRSMGSLAIPLEMNDVQDRGGHFIVMGWYKNRGRTSSVYVMDEEIRPATLLDVEDALRLCLRGSK